MVPGLTSTQKPLSASSWGFDPASRHHFNVTDFRCMKFFEDSVRVIAAIRFPFGLWARGAPAP
jgi:hypothetical protein